jgi:hypothetical protein
MKNSKSKNTTGLQIDRIAHDILEKCNVINIKSDSNNNRLQSKQGKLMITNGLTIKEFEKKFSINKNNNNNINNISRRNLFSPKIINNNINSLNNSNNNGSNNNIE